MNRTFTLSLLIILAGAIPTIADQESGTVILEDDFEREESKPEREQVGNGWGTNSNSRAQGVKQVDLAAGALHITRADVADHGVSVTHEAAFADAVITLRFKLVRKTIWASTSPT